jgi:hypothetical protein
MNDGTVINIKEGEPKFRTKYRGLTNVITYYDNNYATRIIDLKNVKQIQIEIVESNQPLTLIVIIGVVSAFIGLVYLLAMSLKGIGGH